MARSHILVDTNTYLQLTKLSEATFLDSANSSKGR